MPRTAGLTRAGDNICRSLPLRIQFERAMPGKVQCFVAYPSDPPFRAESVELAIKEISDGGVVDIAGWKSASVGGRIIISAICEQIRRCELFIADVTGLNPKVLLRSEERR